MDGEGGTVPEIMKDLQTGNDYLCDSARIAHERLARGAGDEPSEEEEGA